MAGSLQVEIVTPTRLVWKGAAEHVQAPGLDGEFGVLPDHAALLAALRPGIVTVHGGSGAPRYVVGAGFAEAGPDRITLLVDAAEDASTVNKDAAQKALEAAEATLATAEPGSLAAEAALTARDLALVRLGA